MESSRFISPLKPECPLSLIEAARNLARKPKIAIVKADHKLPMIAAKEAVSENIMVPIFIGQEDIIKSIADQLNWDISDFKIINKPTEEESAKTGAKLCGLGSADILMKGHIHTDLFMKSILSDSSGLKINQRLIHLFYISHPEGGKPLVISDAAVNVTPDVETRKDAAQKIVKLLKSLGNKKPKIAFLSATESVIESVPSSVDAERLSKWCTNNIPDAIFSGPLALDTILSFDAAETKNLQKNPVVGDVDAIIVPDIVSGNVLFKALVYLSGGCAAGLVLGAKVPLLLTSRADPPAARLASIALAAKVSNERIILR